MRAIRLALWPPNPKELFTMAFTFDGRAVLPGVEGIPEPSVAPRMGEERQKSLLREEALELARAKNLLENGQPEATLLLLNESSQRFPTGALTQEREALALEGLVRSGKHELARQRARALLARYPKNPLAGRWREIAEGK